MKKIKNKIRQYLLKRRLLRQVSNFFDVVGVNHFAEGRCYIRDKKGFLIPIDLGTVSHEQLSNRSSDYLAQNRFSCFAVVVDLN